MAIEEILNNGIISTSQILYALVFGFFLYYFTRVVHKPKFYCSKNGTWHETLQSNLKELEKDQWPLVWCFWPLWQAGFHTLVMRPKKMDFER